MTNSIASAQRPNCSKLSELSSKHDALLANKSAINKHLKSANNSISELKNLIASNKEMFETVKESRQNLSKLESLKQCGTDVETTIRIKSTADGKDKIKSSEGNILKNFIHRARYMNEKQAAYTLFGPESGNTKKEGKVSLKEALDVYESKGHTPLYLDEFAKFANSEIADGNKSVNDLNKEVNDFNNKLKDIDKEIKLIDGKKEALGVTKKNFSTFIHSEYAFQFLQDRFDRPDGDGQIDIRKITDSIANIAKDNGYEKPFSGKNALAPAVSFINWLEGLNSNTAAKETNKFIKDNRPAVESTTHRGINVDLNTFNLYKEMKNNVLITTRLFSTASSGKPAKDMEAAEAFASNGVNNYQVIFKVQGKATQLSPIHALTYSGEGVESVYSAGTSFKVKNISVEGNNKIIMTLHESEIKNGIPFPY